MKLLYVITGLIFLHEVPSTVENELGTYRNQKTLDLVQKLLRRQFQNNSTDSNGGPNSNNSTDSNGDPNSNKSTDSNGDPNSNKSTDSNGDGPNSYNSRDGPNFKDTVDTVPPGPLILTHYIRINKLLDAKKAAQVKSDAIPSDIKSYSGYITVDEAHGSNLWFWYFPAKGKPADINPWILWLQGGPGVSSLHGLFNEIGPFGFDENNKLKEMRYSWGINHSLLFIDSPVGTGYSFTSGSAGLADNQTIIGEHLYDALQQFLTVFHELRGAPLTIVGESYGGKHVPSLGVQILHRKHVDRQINLYGFAIGNGWIDPMMVLNWYSFIRELGIVDTSYIDKIRKLGEEIMNKVHTGSMMAAYQTYTTLVSFIFDHSSLENANAAYNFLRDDYTDVDFTKFIQQEDMRKALHVGNTPFNDFVMVYDNLRKDFMSSSKRWIEELLEHFPVLMYHGHLDVMAPYGATRIVYDSLKHSGAAKYKLPEREAWRHCGRLAGYYKVGGKLTEVMVRGAGHLVPRDQPSAALGLISAFIRGVSLIDTCAYTDG